MVRRVNIKPEMIAWAIQRAGYDVVAYLSEHPDVDEWYKEEKQPTEKQLEDFAKKIHIPYGYLFLNEPSKEEVPIPMFRGNSGNGGFNLNVYDTAWALYRYTPVTKAWPLFGSAYSHRIAPGGLRFWVRIYASRKRPRRKP